MIVSGASYRGADQEAGEDVETDDVEADLTIATV